MSRLILKGATSGTTELAAAAVAGDSTLTLPASNGSAHQLLKMGTTAGEMAYSDASLSSDQNLSGLSAMNGSSLAGLRNAIINGDFDIWQRGTSFTNPAAGAFVADRWNQGYDGTGATRTISQQFFPLGQMEVPGEPRSFLRYAQTVAGTGATNTFIQQRIEGVRTFAGQQVTLSFYARAASPLTLRGVYLAQVFGTGGSPTANTRIDLVGDQPIDTVWKRYSYTTIVPSISGRTLGTDGNDRLTPVFLLPINEVFTFDLACVQLELGPVATPFERRPIGMELELCQRYYERCYATIVASGWVPIETFVTSKRVVPSLAIVSYVVGSGGGIGPYGFHNFVASSYATVAARVILAGDAEL